MAKEEPKQVPPRNDLKKVEVYGRSRAFELAGRDPDGHYEYKSTDPANPSYHGKFQHKHEVGDAQSGYAIADAWEFASTKEISTGRPRDDQGKPIDTAIRNGDLVLMRTSKDNAEVYAEIDRRKAAAQTKQIAADEVRTPGAKHVHRMGVGFTGSPEELPRQTGA